MNKLHDKEEKKLLESPFQVNFHFHPVAYQAAMKYTPYYCKIMDKHFPMLPFDLD